MKSALEKWLAPEDSHEEGDIISESPTDFDNDPKDLPWEKEEAKSKFSLDTSQAKQTKKDEFDNLFNN